MRLITDLTALTGTLEQSLVNSLRSYAPPPDEDRGAGEPSMAPLGDGAAVQRHTAALTEQAQRLLQDTGPTATDMRMYNMMCTREAIAQVKNPILPHLGPVQHHLFHMLEPACPTSIDMCMYNMMCIWEAVPQVSCHTVPLTVLKSKGSSIYIDAEDGAL